MDFERRILPFISKAVIVIPIVLLLLTFVFLNPEKKQPTSQLVSTPTPTVHTEQIKNIDINGQYICNYSSKDSSSSAFIKMKKIYISNNKDRYLFNGDCLYSWKEKEFTGKKTCGLSNYIGIYENLQKSHLLDLNSVLSNFVPQNQTENIRRLINSCEEKEVKDTRVFIPPANILFKNK